MSVTARVHLPDGYQIQDLGTVLRLYGPDGTLLGEERRARGAATRLEARAWRDVWKQVEREIDQELGAFREGTRPLRDLKRLRQYLRMIDAVERPPVTLDEQPQEQIRQQVYRSRLISGFALAASAAALVVTLLMAQPWLAWGPNDTSDGTLPAASSPTVAKPASGLPSRPFVSMRESSGSKSGAGAADVQRPRRARLRTALRRPQATHVVQFGEFATRTAAEIRMHLVRSKGYVVHVTRIENSFHVLTTPRPQAQAEQLTVALQEIGLPARTLPAKAPQI
jgi:hypothetical protein